MSAINTSTVTSDSTQLWSGDGGAGAVQVINLDTATTVYLGSDRTIRPATINTFPLGPLASQAFDASKPLWAVTAADQVDVGLVPGGTSYSPGTLTIAGPVTAEITGPVEIEGTVDVAGTVEIGGTPTVELAAGTTVDISGTADVNIENANIDVNTLVNITSQYTSPQILNNTNAASPMIQMPANSEGYQVVISVVSPAAGANYAADLIVFHFDAAGHEIGQDLFSVTNLQDGTGQEGSVVRGVVKGTQISVTCFNAAASFLNTIFGVSITAPRITFTVYGLPFLPSGSSVINPADNKIILPAHDVAVTSTPAVINTPNGFSGPAVINLENKGVATQVYQCVIASYTVLNGPTFAVTTYFSPYVSGQSALSVGIALPQLINCATVLLRSGTGSATCDTGIVAAWLGGVRERVRPDRVRCRRHRPGGPCPGKDSGRGEAGRQDRRRAGAANAARLRSGGARSQGRPLMTATRAASPAT